MKLFCSIPVELLCDEHLLEELVSLPEIADSFIAGNIVPWKYEKYKHFQLTLKKRYSQVVAECKRRNYNVFFKKGKWKNAKPEDMQEFTFEKYDYSNDYYALLDNAQKIMTIGSLLHYRGKKISKDEYVDMLEPVHNIFCGGLKSGSYTAKENEFKAAMHGQLCEYKLSRDNEFSFRIISRK